MNEKLSLVFFGSGPVAAESLRLLSQTFTVEAVVTKPSTEKMLQSVAGKAPVYCVENKQALDDLMKSQSFKSRVGVLIDFGIIVSQAVIDYFPKGIVNSHFSLLPKLRGADPISFAILEGVKKTGVSLMLLVQAMDEGPLIAVGEMKLNGNETTPSLTDSLVELSYSLLENTLPAYIQGNATTINHHAITAVSQEESCKLRNEPYEPTYTRKLTKQDGQIDWHKPAQQIEREIRAFTGWPKSRSILGDIECVITRARVEKGAGEPGVIEVRGKDILVYCGTDVLCIESLKPAGKKDMTSEGFLAGYKQRMLKKV